MQPPRSRSRPPEATGAAASERAVAEDGLVPGVITDENFEAAFWQAPTGVALIGMDGRFLRVNDSLCHSLGRTAEQIVGSTSAPFTHPDDQELTAAAFTDLNRDMRVSVEKRYLRPNGEVVWMSTHGTSVHWQDGRPRYIVSHFNDITAVKLAEQLQQEANERFETAFADAPIGMALVGLDGRWLKVNRLLCELTGYAQERLLTLTYQEMTYPEDLDADLAYVERLLAGEIDRYTIEKRYVTASGELVWINLSGSLVRDPDGTPLHRIVHIEDISERKRLEATLQRLADHDPLTDLWTRRRFEEELQRQVSRCRRYGERAALLIVDLDHFKPVNDVHGHKAGDDLLARVAAALQARIRSTDSLARLGGDEFGVILTNTTPDQAADLAEAIRVTVAGAHGPDGGTLIAVTASIGIACLDRLTASDHDAMLHADAAMYEAKAAGGDRASAGGVAVEDEAAARSTRRARRLARATRILHCDDSTSYRRLVSELLAGRPDLKIVAEAETGRAALAAAIEHEPDVVLLDARMDGSNAALIAEMRAAVPGARVVVLSGLSLEASAIGTLADGFVNKSASFDELARVLGEPRSPA